MTVSQPSRARITRMASSRSKRRPCGRTPLTGTKVYSIRFPDDVAAKINAVRGEQEFGSYVRILVEAQLLSPEESALRDCQAHNAQRGITPEMLLAAKAK